VEYATVWQQEVADLKAENETLLNEVKKLKERRN
jgi:FtsZ-binding cell division protein ZapB